MKGRRRDPVDFGTFPDDLQPGDYWRYLTDGKPMTTEHYDQGRDTSSNLTGRVYGYSSPDGGGLGTLVLHTIREHRDGTISVRPGDGSSNSILHDNGRGKIWHGYIEHGEWREG